MTYLGTFDVNIEDTEFKEYKPTDWAMYFIESYGQIDGADHKQWVIDQVTQILKGTKVIVKLAKWDNGQTEYRISLDEPSEEYKQWLIEYCEDGEYDYDEGIAPALLMMLKLYN